MRDQSYPAFVKFLLSILSFSVAVRLARRKMPRFPSEHLRELYQFARSIFHYRGISIFLQCDPIFCASCAVFLLFSVAAL